MNKSEQLIACLEGEIAKRDAWIVELESDLAGTQSRVLSLQDQWRKLDAELAALKAQDTVGEVVGWYRLDRPYEMTSYPSVCAAWHKLGAPVAPLYAAPVSEAKAQVYEPLVCDYCNAETQDPWHGSGMLNGVESRHIHACSQCRNLLPTAKALAVRDEEIERIRVQLMTIASAEPARHSIEWAKAVAATGNNEVYAKWREAFDERNQQAQRIGELEGLLREVHDTYRAAIHWEDLRGTMKRIDAALSAGKKGE